MEVDDDAPAKKRVPAHIESRPAQTHEIGDSKENKTSHGLHLEGSKK
jgi:hypothetical protein